MSIRDDSGRVSMAPSDEAALKESYEKALGQLFDTFISNLLTQKEEVALQEFRIGLKVTRRARELLKLELER